MRKASVIDVVLVGLDGSAFAATALPVAGGLSDSLGAEVHVVSVVADEMEIDGRAAEIARATEGLRHARRSVIVNGDVAEVIHEALEQLAPAVLCLASRGRGRSAALIGSVATDIVDRARHAAVLVGPEFEPKPRRMAPATRGVVACVDGTQPSLIVLPDAMVWAELLSEPLIVLTVADPSPEPLRGESYHRRYGPDGDADEYVRSIVEPLRPHHSGVIEATSVLDPISPASGVRDYLRAHPARLAVVASRGRRGARRLVFGSTSAAIVRRSPAPVLVVPGDER